MMPKVLLFYWHGCKIPQWRYDNFAKLCKLYPEANIISSTGDTFSIFDSEKWRIDQCSKIKNCLWIDNDIELNEPLALSEQPALADEYEVGHISLIWSGLNPSVFLNLITDHCYNNRYLQHRVKCGMIQKVKITGTHWGSDAVGNKTKRMV